MGLFDNPSGSPSTSLGIGMSISAPNFNISLSLGNSWQGTSWLNRLNLQVWDNATLETFLNKMNPYSTELSGTPAFGSLNLGGLFTIDQNQAAVDRLTGSNINYGQLALSSGLSILGNSLQNVGGPVGDAAGRVLNSAGTVVNSISNLKEIGNLSSQGVKGLGTAKAGNVAAIAGAAADLIGSFMPEKTEYAGDKGNITQTMDSVYDGISDAAMAFGPVGMMVGGIMKGGKLLGQGVNALGGGTDGMTPIDAILGSSFLNLTPIGLINGFGGQKAETITKDETAFETVGASYTGSNLSVNAALLKSGKKYGLFSSGPREKANEEILEARRLQAIISDIADESTGRFAIRNSMSAINGNRRALALQGGYNLAAIRAGRNGMVLAYTAKRICSKYLSDLRLKKFLEGGKTQDPFEVYFNSLPSNQKDSANFRVRDYWEFNGRPVDFSEAIKKGMFVQFEDGWHANSVAENPKTGEIEFMKSSLHPSHLKEVDWYNSDDASEFRGQYDLVKSEPYWKYVKKKPSFKLGGVMEIQLSDVPKEFLESSIAEVTLDSVLPEFREGGKVNVIPEGALHARLHHMENAENLTKKGIPVVSEKDGGELEQQAEIEREELILRLEVTEKLEELRKTYTDSECSLKDKDEAALEAGKLLVEEILNNTIDNTNKLL